MIATDVLGLHNPTGIWYLFWSGIGGDLLTVLPLLLGIIVWYRHNKCQRCLRLGRHIPHYHALFCKFHVPAEIRQDDNPPTAMYG